MLSPTVYNPRQLTSPFWQVAKPGSEQQWNEGLDKIRVGWYFSKTIHGWNLFLIPWWREHLYSFWWSGMLPGHLHSHLWIVSFSRPHTGSELLLVDLKIQWRIIWLELDSVVQQPADPPAKRKMLAGHFCSRKSLSGECRVGYSCLHLLILCWENNLIIEQRGCLK